MIALVEGAQRQKTPNEIALNILIAGLTLIFLLAVDHAAAVSRRSAWRRPASGIVPTVAVLVSLLVCLIPTTIGGLLSAIGIAGMDRVMQHNVLAMSGKAVEAAGDVNSLLLDKTGTITLGNRQAVEFLPVERRHGRRTGRRRATIQPGRRNTGGPLGGGAGQGEVRPARPAHPGARGDFIPFSAYTRMSGVDCRGPPAPQGRDRRDLQVRQRARRRSARRASRTLSDRISRSGGTPLAVADGTRLLGVIHLKDIVKGGMKERIAQLRRMGIRSIMITGDNPLTAAAIAAEAGTIRN